MHTQDIPTRFADLLPVVGDGMPKTIRDEEFGKSAWEITGFFNNLYNTDKFKLIL